MFGRFPIDSRSSPKEQTARERSFEPIEVFLLAAVRMDAQPPGVRSVLHHSDGASCVFSQIE